MSLPVINSPTHMIEIPSTKKSAKFRSMKIKEEKILLTAKESQEDNDILNAIVQIIGNCAIDGDVDPNKLTMFDVEYLFLKIRSISVSNKINLSIPEQYEDGEDTKIKNHEFNIDLDDVKMKYPDEEIQNTIQVDDIAIELKYPSIQMNLSDEYKSAEKESEVMTILLKNSIKSIFQGDQSIKFTLDELDSFIDDLPASVFETISKFFDSQPSLYYKLEYKDVKNKKQSMELTTLSDFFIF